MFEFRFMYLYIYEAFRREYYILYSILKWWLIVSKREGIMMRIFGFIIYRIAFFFFRRKVQEFVQILELIQRDNNLRFSSQVRQKLEKCLIVAEDKRFYLHRGIDLISLIRSILIGIIHNGKIRGMSTVEQQLVRTITNNKEYTIKRKVNELLLATVIEPIVPKNEILFLYLKLAYFGWRMNGIEQVFKRLDYSFTELSLSQAASIIARLKYPEPRSPSRTRIMQIETRKRYILDRLRLKEEI